MNTEKHAAEVLLDRGVGWKIPSPWYLRMLGKKSVSISVKSLRLGTLLELSRLYCSMGIAQEDIEKAPHAIITKHLGTVCRIAAVCILNSKTRIRLFSRPLGRYLMSNLTANMLLEVMIFVVTYSGMTSFISTIRLIGELRMTAPKNLSPEDQGSQQ